jgi:hypothetical protein
LNSPVSSVSNTILRPPIPPWALHQDAKTFAVTGYVSSLVKLASVNTPTRIWLAVTPWAGAPDALPGWQTPVSVPKLAPVPCPPAVAPGALAPALPDSGDEPARPQPAASRTVTQTATQVLTRNLTGPPR